jgi:branched-chain amino acid transport system substrate-binding protein
MKKKYLLIIFFVLSMGFIFAGDGFSKTETLLIGVDAPLTGPASTWGIGQMRSTEMRVDEYNAKGGLVINGINYKLKYLAYDNKATAAEAASVAKKLIYDKKVKYLLGAAVGATCRGIQTITAPNDVMFTFCCWGKMLLGKKVPLNFRVGHSPFEMADAFLSGIKRIHPNIKTIATFSPNDTSGWDGGKGAIRAAKAVGIKCVAEEYYERGTTDFHASLTRVLAKKPDLIELAASPMSTGGILLKQAYEMGYRGHKSWLALSMPIGVIKIAGPEATEGLYQCASWDYYSPKFTLPLTGEVMRKYKKRYGEEWDYFGFNNYAIVKIIFETMQREQTIDPVKVAEAMVANQPYLTFLGPVVFGNESVYGLPRSMLHPLVVSQVRKGKLVNISYGLHPDLKKVIGDWRFPQE